MSRKNPRPPYKWSQEEKDFIFANYKGCGYINMTKRLIETFGSDLSRSQVKAFYSKHKLNSGLTGRFEKGHVPITPAHFKVWEDPRAMKNRFKKGHIPHNTKPVGTILKDYDKDKKHVYLKIKVSDSEWKQLHAYNWEQAYGPYDKSKYCILFKDGNTLNCDISNLELITRQEHVFFNHYKVPRKFNSSEEIETYKAIVHLRSSIYRRKFKNVRYRNGRNKNNTVFSANCENSERNSSAAQGKC